MARKRRKRTTKPKMRARTCKIVNTPGGRRKLCKMSNGKVKFKPMSFRFK